MASSSSGMEPCYPNSRSQCNRQPFLSESGCDRGSVDIHQFDDLPYCGPINPTEPNIPKEIVDVPVSVPLPSFSCSCFNMEIKPKFQYNGKRKFVASASFKAIGDCCEGNYETNIDLQIPCPVYGNGDKKIRMSIGYGESKSYFSSTYMSVNSSSCEIKVKDIDVNLNIPCPVVSKGFDKEQKKYAKMVATIYIEHWADGRMVSLERVPPEEYSYSFNKKSWTWTVSCRHVSVSFIGIYQQTTSGYWRVSSHSEHIELYYGGSFYKDDGPGHDHIIGLGALYVYGLPPEHETYNDGKLHIGISYGKDFEGGAASVIGMNHGSCTIEALSPSINLNIPCPVVGNKPKDVYITVKADIKEKAKVIEEKILSIDPEDCKIEPFEPTLNIEVPCVIDRKPVIQDCLKLNRQIAKRDMSFSVKTSTGNFRPISFSDLEFNMEPDGGINSNMTYTYGYNGEPMIVLRDTGTGNTVVESVSEDIRITQPKIIGPTGKVKQEARSWTGDDIRDLLGGAGGIGPLATVQSGMNPKKIYSDYQKALNGSDSYSDKKLHVSVEWGSSQSSGSAYVVEADPETCNLRVRSPSIHLDIPCPLRDDRLKMLASTTGIGGLSINEINYDPEKCERDIEFHVDFPSEDNIIEILRKRFKIFEGCKDVVTDTAYDTRIHALKQKLTNVCTGESRWVVFTYAQKHTGSC